MDRIDLNCDVGESFGIYKFGNDEELLGMVSSANIACGFHAGDPRQMTKTVEICLENGVAIGAHPGFPDLSGFGRRVLKMNRDEITSMILYQAGALMTIAKALGGTVEHIKPHGALYNVAAYDREIGNALTDALLSLEGPALVALAGSPLVDLARTRGIKVIEEAFADRNYMSDGSLVRRDQPEAVINEPEKVAQRITELVRGEVTALDGKKIKINAETICVHGDNPGAIVTAREITRALNKFGITILKPSV